MYLPRQDYRKKQRGPFTSWSTTWQLAVKINQEGVMEQLAAAWTELTQFQQQHWLEEGQRQQEERRQHDEDQRRQQYEAYQEQVRIMHEQQVEQMGVMREVLKIHVDWNTTTLENVTVTRKKLPEKVEWNSRAELANAYCGKKRGPYKSIRLKKKLR